MTENAVVNNETGEIITETGDISKLAVAVVAMQGELKPVAKNSENPFFKSKYADLAACHHAAGPILARHGLAVVQIPSVTQDGVIIKTILLHESGQKIEAECKMKPKSLSPQDIGSAITYNRRYSYMAIIGLSAEDDEDDDGNASSGKKKTGDRKPSPAPEPCPSAPADGKKMASEKQVKMIFALCKKSGVIIDDIKKSYNFSSSKELENKTASKIIDELQSMKPAAPEIQSDAVAPTGPQDMGINDDDLPD